MTREERLEWDEKEFNKISNDLENKDFISHYEFLRIRNFKTQNSTNEDEAHIKKITEKAVGFAKKDEIKKAVSILQEELNGVGIPVASTILAMRFSKRYCIIDRRVIEKLEKKGLIKKDEFKGYLTSPEIYEKYLKLMREEAKKSDKKDLREFEKSLYEESVKESLRKNNKTYKGEKIK